MKKVIMASLFALVTIVSFGQDRINRAKLSFEKSSDVFNEATGWKYNETLGEWIDFKNVVSSEKNYKEKYKTLQGRYQMSKEGFNFNSIQIKTLNFNGKSYYILIHNKWCGRYKYPSIREDWIEYESVDGFILDEGEYENLKNFNTVKLVSQIRYDLEFENYNETKFLDLIQNEISKGLKRSYNWVMLVKKTNDGKVRFLTPSIMDLFENKKYMTASYDFNKMYFETDVDNFSKILAIR